MRGEPGLRIQMRLYEHLEEDALVIAWIESLPTSRRGKRLIKEPIIRILAEEIRRQQDAQDKRVARPKNRGNNSANGIEVTKLPLAEKAAAAETVETLPAFPDINELRF